MALTRATFFFTDRTYGWSETHFSARPGDSLQQVMAFAQFLARLRTEMLGTGVELGAIRVSDDLVRRDSLLAVNGSPSNPANWQGVSAFPGSKADLPYSVTLVRAEGGTKYRKSIYLSGVPDSMQVDASQGLYTPKFIAAFDAWANILKRDWAFKVTLVPPDVPSVAITGINAPGPNAIVTAPAHGLQTGQRVQIAGVSYSGPKKAINGKWFVVVTSLDTFVIPSTQTFTYLGGGLVYALLPDVKAYTNVLIRGQTHRKRGRPFDSPVGRRRRT